MMKTSILAFTLGILVAGFVGAVQARDDGRYSQSPLKPWFDSLKSGKGPCCSDADGFAVSDPDWESRNGHRSEEHTSELQSRLHLVCRLLLEKKNYTQCAF